jgi:uncharacterized protein
MRLSEFERDAIVASVTMFDGAAEVYLFGSRVDDDKKGGDIDVIIKSDVLTNDMLDLVAEELFKHIDEQKVDFVLTGKSRLSSFAEMVLSKGVVNLCRTKS